MWPRLPMSCMAVSIHARWGRPISLGWPGMECAKGSCLTMTSLGLRAACPDHMMNNMHGILYLPMLYIYVPAARLHF